MKKINLTADKKPGEHFFFGYYDLQPYSSDNSLHLAHKVSFIDRLPLSEDTAEIGYIDTDTLKFSPIATTGAWNFQQGALLQWFDDKRSVIFNDFDGKEYVSRVVGTNGKEITRYDRPFASVSRATGKALSVNFARIYDFRKGYGYCNIPDPFKSESAPDGDGIFATDLKTGKSNVDIRCDLHARFSPDDSRISYDTTENGVREIMQLVL